MRSLGLYVAVGVLTLLSVSACDNNAFSSPLSIRADGEQLLVAACGESVLVERVYASSRNQDDGINWFRFFDAAGEIQLETGEVLALSGSIPGLETKVAESPLLSRGTDIAVTMVSVEQGESLATDFLIRDAVLSENEWLRADGSTSQDPCDDTKQN